MKIIIKFGKSTAIFYTEYHAEQFERALRLNGTDFTKIILKSLARS